MSKIFDNTRVTIPPVIILHTLTCMEKNLNQNLKEINATIFECVSQMFWKTCSSLCYLCLILAVIVTVLENLNRDFLNVRYYIVILC